MKINMQNIKVPFPVHMMSSSRSEYNMPTDYAKYIKNMIINHTGSGSKRNGFIKVDNDLPENEKVIKLKYFPSLNGEIQFLAFTESGCVYKRLITSEWELIFSDFSQSTNYSIASFDDSLIIANGKDVLYSYNGESFSKIYQYISQKDFFKQRASSSSIKTDVFKEDFPIGREVQIELENGKKVFTTVSHYSDSIDDKYYILHFNDSIISEDIVDISYKLYCPAFSMVYSYHDRLWAIGSKGNFDINKLSVAKDKSRVFYTDKVNDASSWFDIEGNLCSINLADKIPENEELVGMGTKDNMTVFFFRSYSQVWQGTNPKATGDFSWIKTLPVGLCHPELLVEMPNDLGFFSQFGARTFSRMLQTEQLDVADMGSEMTTDIHNALEKVKLSSKVYKNIHSFQFHKQNWFAFKLDEEVLVFQISQGILSWSKFDGIFSKATAFLNTPDGNLYAIVNNKLYIYDTDSFSDSGDSIHTVWMTPWFDINSKIWANKYTEILVEPSALKTAEVRRFKNYNSASYIIKEVNLKSMPDYFDNSYWDNAYYDSAIQEKTIIQDKYVANNMAYSIQTNDNEGPLTINGLKLYGSKEK